MTFQILQLILDGVEVESERPGDLSGISLPVGVEVEEDFFFLVRLKKRFQQDLPLNRYNDRFYWSIDLFHQSF